MTQRSDVGQYIGKTNIVEALQRCCKSETRQTDCSNQFLDFLYAMFAAALISSTIQE